MRRWPLIVAVLLAFAFPLHAASSDSLVPDGHGGITAFVGIGKNVYAVPIDANGVSHPEQASLVFDNLNEQNVFAIDRTSAGWLIGFSDPAGIGYTEPLAADFSSLAQPHPLGRDWPVPVVCHNDSCAVNRQINAAIVRYDGVIAGAASYPGRDLDIAGIAAASAGGEIALIFNTYTVFPGFPPVITPARYAAYAMRLSDTLAAKEGPVAFAPGAVSRTIGILASGDAFFAPWSVTNTPVRPH